MAIVQLFSRRKKQLESAEKVDIFKYDYFPREFRVQVVHVWSDILPRIQYDNQEGLWHAICQALAREYGLFRLTDDPSAYLQCVNYFLNTEDINRILDIIELVTRYALFFQDNYQYNLRQYGISVTVADGISELNGRFREHCIGYEFEGNELLRVDSRFTHEEIVKPALRVLQDIRFRKANEEFIQAHKYYRANDYKSCVVACLRCFESLLKAICDENKWTYDAGDTATTLITKVRQQGLFPDYLGKSFDNYIALLKTGLPNIRNNAGGHGESKNDLPTPSYIPAYALHTTSTNIVMLASAFSKLDT